MNFERCYVEKPLDTTKGKVFNKSQLLSKNEERGVYWIKKIRRGH